MCLSRPVSMVEFDKWASQVENRLGRIPLMGRYHMAPRSIKDDYIATEKVLGKGCSGLVRMATSICDSERKFAVKAFNLGDLREIEISHLKGELATSLCLDHPNVARLADVYEDKNELYLVTECIEGGELYQRLVLQKRFLERNAANAMRQILLALNYLHSHGIVHRDLKLENFLYDSETSDKLKLIDFGFFRFFKDAGPMNSTCGTLSYLAPEVLTADYSGSTCDMWSAGVISFILLSGSMPFHGSQKDKVESIYHGKYSMKPEVWKSLSSQAKDFITGLLNTNPKARLTASSALAHPWILQKCKGEEPLLKDPHHIVDALSSWKSIPKLRRACLTMLAWSLCEKERATFRDYFLALDCDHNGTISFAEFKKAMQKDCGIKTSKVNSIFQDLAHDNDDEIRYSDFIAVLMSKQMDKVDETLLHTAFRKFDKNNSGYVTPDDFSQIVGLEYEGAISASLFLEADIKIVDGRIDFDEFAEYVKHTTPSVEHEARQEAPKIASRLENLDNVSIAKIRREEAAQQQCCTLM